MSGVNYKYNQMLPDTLRSGYAPEIVKSSAQHRQPSLNILPPFNSLRTQSVERCTHYTRQATVKVRRGTSEE